MAVVNTLSPIISNYDAQPRILTSGYISGANDTVGVATQSLAATDNIGSTYRLAFIPSGVRIEDMQLVNTASTAGAFSLGVYCNDQQAFKSTVAGAPVTAAPGAVPVTNAQLIFGAGISTASASVNWKSVYSPTILSAAFAATNTSLRVWELLGLDADPFYEFHLVLTATTAPTAAATLAVQYSWAR
jgi:hypothetical protein